MSFMRYLSPAMDQMFMNSLQWVDQTYLQKHKSEDPSGLRAMYYPNLRLYSEHAKTAQKKEPKEAMTAFFMRFGKKAVLSLGIYLLSFIPYVGRFVLPAASFYTFNKAVGLQPAVLIFGSSLFLPKRYLVMFLQSYFSSRSLMRELVSLNLEMGSPGMLLTLHSSSRTFHASDTPRSRNESGSTTAKASSTVSPSLSSSSSKYLSSASSSTVWQKPQLPISSRRSPSHLQHQQKQRSSRRWTSSGRTNTSSYPCH